MKDNKLHIYNTLTKKKTPFIPLNSPHAGMYVCGPTVYGDPHLGHARAAITYDILFRRLKYLGYNVRYVRNITDVGHLLGDANDGEDKILRKARLEQLEPMEVAQYYTNRYNKAMEMLNILPPSIEPHASGHILEQIDFVQKILDAGYAYESNGSVYFDVEKYNRKTGNYGKLSGRNIEELLETTRELDGQSEKRRSADFALWKKAAPEHLMHWKSPWSEGFPGWHLECSAMSVKYLGEEFDIHGGGMDLMFPHHECEIAQSVAALGKESVHCWMHNNMITINGQKMGKSLDNFITLEELFTGQHPLLTQAYSPMSIRFFILQAHYRSTLDFSNEALQASEKGLNRILDACKQVKKIHPSDKSIYMETGEALSINDLHEKCEAAMDDDLNTAVVISCLFDAVRIVNAILSGNATVAEDDLHKLEKLFHIFLFEILGIRVAETQSDANQEAYQKAVDLLLAIRQDAKLRKDWTTSDTIRNQLTSFGFEIKDTKDGVDWKLN
ncbi:MAG: cysteine--tRNA ligase [Bacteroidales bacterium]|jgi:cysteinyl-tRNA synthetase|nr:cysteine--tRNA ligase [Bacteroidales bacterium]